MSSNLKRTFSLTLLVCAASSVFAAPAPVTEINNATSTNTSATSQVRTPETDVQRLERLLRNRASMQLKMQQQLDDMSAELDELRGLVERNSYDMKQMLDRQREVFIELDKLRTDVKSPSTFGNEPAEVKDEDSKPAGTFSTNSAEDAAYKSAVSLILKQKDYESAITALKKFQSDFPESEFTPNIHYWLGQLYFAKKMDKEATKNFLDVVSFKDSNKRADSIVKLGDIATRNKQPELAKQYYQQVIKEHANSASAKSAKNKLK